MKRKLLTAIVSIAVVVLCAFCFLACDGDDDSEHVHAFDGYVYNNDATCVKDGTETGECTVCHKENTCTKVGSAIGQRVFINYSLIGWRVDWLDNSGSIQATVVWDYKNVATE